MRARREAHYKETGETISGYAIVKEFRAAKDTEFPWFRKYAARVEETAYRALDAAYDRFFRMCRGDLPKPKLRKPRKDGKPAGFPRFKSRKQGPTPFKFWGLKPEHIEPQRIRFQRIVGSASRRRTTCLWCRHFLLQYLIWQGVGMQCTEVAAPNLLQRRVVC